MIIQVCGHLIDTQYIYEITEIKTWFYDSGWDDGYGVSGSFTINFLDKKSIEINNPGNGIYKTMHTPAYKTEESRISKQLNNVRDQLICKWKANQLAIPKIEFNES